MRIPPSFHADQHEATDEYKPLPVDDYNVKIVDTEIKRTRKAEEMNDDNLGQLLKIKFEVLDGKYKGRYLWTQLNIINPNEMAVEISQKQLSSICRAVRLVIVNYQTNDKGIVCAPELHGKPLKVTVSIEKGDAQYGDKNVINGYKEHSLGLDSSFDPEKLNDDIANDDIAW